MKRRDKYCSFCGRSSHEVRDMVAGPSVSICDQCVEDAKRIMLENAIRAGLKPQPLAVVKTTKP